MSEQSTTNHGRHVPVNANQQHKSSMRPLDRLGFDITKLVGTMVCAILFTCLALISLPSAIKSHSLIIIVAWIAQTFLQLVLLPIIIVGQNIQSKHGEILADEAFKATTTTYHDMEQLLAMNQKQLDLLTSLKGQK